MSSLHNIMKQISPVGKHTINCCSFRAVDAHYSGTTRICNFMTTYSHIYTIYPYVTECYLSDTLLLPLHSCGSKKLGGVRFLYMCKHWHVYSLYGFE